MIRMSWAGAVVAVGLLSVAGLELLSSPAPEPATQLASSSLVGASDSAMFTERDMVPGRSIGRCIVVHGTSTAGAVRLVAEGVTGQLAPYLDLTVEVGAGGSAHLGGSASCRGFTGTVVFADTLAGLAHRPAGRRGVPSGWFATGTGDARTFRITVRVADDNAAQGKTVAADLRWILAPATDPATPGPRPSGTARTAKPAKPAKPAATPSPSRTTGVPASTAPVHSPAGPPTAPGGVTGSSAGDDGPHIWSVLRRVLDAMVDVAAKSSRHAAVPLLALLITLLFIAVQDRIDRRDPKLVLAPLTRHRYVDFDADADIGVPFAMEDES